ncbi:MAG: hypothetical protein WBD37_13925 [Anderseniella sp.]
MATDYHNESRSHAPDYRTTSGGSSSWLVGLVIAALIGLIGIFLFTGPNTTTTGPATGTTTEQVVPVPPATTAPAQ